MSNDIHYDVAVLLSGARRQKGFTMDEMAAMVPSGSTLSKGRISDIENRRGRPVDLSEIFEWLTTCTWDVDVALPMHLPTSTAPTTPAPPPPDIFFDVGGLGSTVTVMQIERMAGMWNVTGQRIQVTRAEVLNWIAEGKANGDAAMRVMIQAWIMANPPF